MKTDTPNVTYALAPDRVWDGVSDGTRDGVAVVVKGRLVDAVLPVGEVPADMETAVLPDCTLLPGLIDAHVHYSSVMGAAFLAAGVTTIRDVGNDLAWILGERDRHAGDPAAGPAILCCGHLLDGPRVYWPQLGRAHASPGEIADSVRRHAEAGVDQIKLYAGVDPPLLKAAVDAAHESGKFVVAHLQATTAEDAARLGLDEFEHLAGCGVAWRGASEVEDDLMIDLLLERDVIIDPTLVVWDRLGRILDRPFHHDGRRAWVHPRHLDIWQRYLGRFGPPEYRWRYQGAMAHLKRFLRRAHQRGVTVALGTDTPFPHLVPGMSVHDELAIYTDAGIPAVDALRSATSINARVLGIDDRAGTIRPGLRADLVAVRGNPLERIEDIENVRCTVREGRRFKPAGLMEVHKAAFDREPDGAVTRDLLDYVDGKLVNRPAS